jgi:putative molybdopterin biosynthesis protein
MKSKRRGRRYFLDDIPLDEAIRRFHAALDEAGALEPSPPETVRLDEASGRVTAEPVWAKASSPHYDAAAMDGVAVRSRETVGATETSPVRLTVGEQVVWLDTGDPMPEGFDAVIMVEVVHEVDGFTIEVQSPVPPYQHVRPLGEDIVATELLLPQHHRLRPQDVAACAAAGLREVAVRRAPRVAVIPTGTELVPVGAHPKPGQIIESNSLMLAAMVTGWGGEATRKAPVPDDLQLLRDAVLQAVQSADIVVVNAGSSGGSEDFTATAVEELGRLLVHGVALRPGHPVVLGLVRDKPVLGIPGYPVSAAVTSELFLMPLVERKLGLLAQRRRRITARTTRKVHSPVGEDEYLRVGLGRVGSRMVVTPIQRGAGAITSLVRADGLVVIPRFSEGIEAGEEVDVELLRPAEDLERTIVAIGSHDMALDLLASELHRANAELRLVSSNVGSLGGLLALGRGEAHMAGCHLLDEDTGEYNISFVRRYVKESSVVVMNLVHRVQGLIVPAGNPKSITSLGDLGRDGVTFVNRQRGSGTRVLLDYMLRRETLDPGRIHGYAREEYTHLAVAAAVAGGRADTGLGVLSASRAMGVDFVPLMTEQYDLVIPAQFYDSELLAPMLKLVRGDGFRAKVEALGGYDTTKMGEVVAELGSDRS